ncbi:hypothetical protein H0I23_03640 [Cellulophaga sp. HaHaR_3_176]|uniref:hypothetical protein n=1 Tax=Cellulophaga sp. HaHaR_3_176 TaxID=1942464 RepID=UPI001C1FA769|nr:hypothetical protein [Cellulophaga sp. HaHaR_3_176]QWX84747.1 hypothetical protein H0I23_03640 [Cellulophaga sp. HaHaR_3_176]
MHKLVYIVICFIFLACSSKKEEPLNIIVIKAELLLKNKKYNAGDSIIIPFKINNQSAEVKLHIKNAFGTLLLNPEIKNEKIIFSLPTNFSRKSGFCHWKLLEKGQTILKGKIEISPNVEKGTNMETYFGPRSITAGYKDYSMLVISPTDIFDNTVIKGTEVIIKSQFQKLINEYKVETTDLMAWYNVRSTTKAGRILVTSECNERTSKELTTIVFPSNSTNFKIKAFQDHDYADGNQILKLKSDIIKDEFGNIVSDGTLVTFIIENDKKFRLYTVGTTISGVVEARTLHPSEAANWNVQAFITGASESNVIDVDFRTAITDFQIYFSKHNRNIDIGPIESFMKQLVPDGILVQLDIYTENGEFIETKKTTTKEGVSSIFLSPEYLDDGTYRLVIKAAGITKEFTKQINGT